MSKMSQLYFELTQENKRLEEFKFFSEGEFGTEYIEKNKCDTVKELESSNNFDDIPF